MQAKGGGGGSRGGGIGRVAHPADKTLADIARAQRKVYAKAQRDVEVTLLDYIFRGKRPGVKGGGGGSRGGGTGRIRTGYDTKKSLELKRLFRGLKWLAVRDAIALTMLLANRAALDIANENAAEIMADGATYTAYTFREEYDALPYTEKVVESLARENLLTLPQRTVDRDKDADWTRRMLQSIVNNLDLTDADPEALPGIIAQSLVKRCQRSMDTTTQALIYGVFDMGMYYAGMDAQNAGVDTEKTWLSIMDDFVRDSHHKLHLTTIPMNALFHGIYGVLRFPHDPSAPAPEIMRCRCRMAIHLKGKAPTAPTRLTRAEVAAYRKWRDQTIDALGGELELVTEQRRRHNGRKASNLQDKG